MQEKKFEVEVYYTGFCTFEVVAKNEAEAILKARTLPIDQNQLLASLENWEDADIVKSPHPV